MTNCPDHKSRTAAQRHELHHRILLLWFSEYLPHVESLVTRSGMDLSSTQAQLISDSVNFTYIKHYVHVLPLSLRNGCAVPAPEFGVLMGATTNLIRHVLDTNMNAVWAGRERQNVAKLLNAAYAKLIRAIWRDVPGGSYPRSFIDKQDESSEDAVDETSGESQRSESTYAPNDESLSSDLTTLPSDESLLSSQGSSPPVRSRV